MFDLLIRGGTAVTAGGSFRADIAVENGRIRALLASGAPFAAKKVVDAAGLLVFPGLIDAHVHLREPGAAAKETLMSGTAAAACGGVTTVLDMPNTVPPVDSLDRLKEKAALIPGRAFVDVGLFAVLTGADQERLHRLSAGGCTGFKVFLGPTTGHLTAPGWGELAAALEFLAPFGLPVVVHAEMGSVIEYLESARQAAGQKWHYDHFLATRPAWAEDMAVSLICRLSGLTGAPIHLAHLSSASAVTIVKEAKKAGFKVSAETCPHYLFLTAADYAEIGPAMKILPPVREKHDQAALWEGLLSGVIDMVASDHAPHTMEEKMNPDPWAAPAGAPGLETMFPLLLDAAIGGRFTPAHIAAWCAARPAAIFQLSAKGDLQPGKDADLVLVDPAADWVVDPTQMHSKAKATPFRGRRGRGRVIATYLRGELVAENGRIVAAPAGRWLEPR
ncbi:MAG TPA: allantoinase AllB [Firmicutes bacterium]|nr:allantoinase AllB [Bacillota bacterium]